MPEAMKHSRCRALAAVWIFAPALLAGADRGSVVFYASFDGSADAAFARGSPAATLEAGAAAFAPGIRGQALKAGAGEAAVRYEVAQNLAAEEGTIEFWMHSVNWDSFDKVAHLFFQAAGEGGLRIYRQAAGTPPLLRFELAAAGRDWKGAQDKPSITPGQWLHIVATWNRREFCTYFDSYHNGLPVPDPPLPKSLSAHFSVGDLPMGGSRKAQTLIDELYIYDRALAKEEVKWAFEHGKDRPAGEDVPEGLLPPCTVEARWRPSLSRVDVTAVLSTRAPAMNRAYRSRAFTGSAELIPPADTKPATVSPAEDGSARASIAFDSLPAGRYEVKVTLRTPAGEELGSGSIAITSPGPPVWRGNRIGIADVPPPPFTALELDQGAGGDAAEISCWGRTYQLGGEGFPEQITTQGRELLAGPIRLVAATGGEPVTWTPQATEILAATEVEVRIKGTSESRIGRLNWLLTAEYDGMLRYDLTLEPTADAVVDLLELRIPVRGEHAPLASHVWGNPTYSGTPDGALPTGEGTVYEQKFMPYFWLGDADGGLCAYCESHQAWQKVEVPGGFRIDRRGETVEAVWSFAREKWQLPRPWKFSFAVTATPVKDTSNGRQWRPVGHLPSYPVIPGHFSYIWATRKTEPFFGYPQPCDPKTYRRLVDWYHDQGVMATPYVLLLAFSAGSPEGQFYRDEWINSIADTNVEGKGDTLMTVSVTPDYTDFIVWKCHQFVTEMDLDGMYHDWSGVYPSTNRLAGCGYERDGTVYRTWPFFANRRLYKRIYTMLKTHRKHALMIGNNPNHYYVPTVTFLDAVLRGEELAAPKNKSFDQLLLPLEFYQADFLGHNMGCRVLFWASSFRYRPDPTAHVDFVNGMMLLHDATRWFADNTLERVYRVIDRYGFVDAEFIPYWRNGDVIRGQTETVKATIYRKQGGGALIVVCNLAERPQRITLDVDWAGLKSPGPLEVVDALPAGWDELIDWDIPLDGNTMTLELAPISRGYCFRLIRVR